VTEEQAHLHLDRHASRPRRRQQWRLARYRRVPHDEIGSGKVGLAVFTEDVTDRQIGQLAHRRGQLLGVAEIGHRHHRALLRQETRHAETATVDPEAHHQRPLPGECRP